MSEFYRDTWVEIDLDALIHNYNQFNALHLKQDMMAVIKANAYGHGDIQVAKLFAQLGATYLAVSSLDEGLKLRHHGIHSAIIVLAPVKIQDVEVAAEFDITLIAYDEGWVEELAKLHLTQPLKLHLEVETGMNRIGLKEVLQAYTILSKMDQVIIEGIYTHIASGDSDLESVARQLAVFSAIINSFEPNAFKYIHVANTATTLQFELEGINMQRVGIGLYGINPDDGFITTALDLQPAFNLHAQLTQVSRIKKNEAVSYSGTFIADEEMVVGTLSVGYADGWCRLNQGRKVIIKGHECEIIGRVCMDQMMIKLPSADFQRGDVVTLIGQKMSANRVANELGTIPYEVLTLINDRVPRVYQKNGEVVDWNLGRFRREKLM